jgi:hypothetical protein
MMKTVMRSILAIDMALFMSGRIES